MITKTKTASKRDNGSIITKIIIVAIFIKTEQFQLLNVVHYLRHVLISH